MKALGYDDPLGVALRASIERAEEIRKSNEHDDTMRLVDPNWKG